MNYPNYNTYSKLYGRYLSKPVDRFFEQSNPLGKRVLDLCAGGGQLSQYALDHGASEVVMIDNSPWMLNPKFNGRGRTYQLETTVEGLFKNFRTGWHYKTNGDRLPGIKNYFGGRIDDEQFDIAVCRQAINYWFLNVNGEDIAKVVKSGGWLVFNTFGNKPSETPTVREYFHEGIAYKEISYRIDERIHHVQTATGISPHMTEFDWIAQADYRTKLSPYFNLNEVIDGPSSMWYCRRI